MEPTTIEHEHKGGAWEVRRVSKSGATVLATAPTQEMAERIATLLRISAHLSTEAISRPYTVIVPGRAS